MTRIFRAAALLAWTSLFFAGAVSGQVWVKKEYTKWSKSDCQKLLNDSPWASSYTYGTVLFQPVGEPSAVSGRDTAPQFTYVAQFWSARPVREAIVRMQQLDPKYDKLPLEQKKVLDDRSMQFLNTEFPDTIVIQVTYSAPQAIMLSMVRFWKQKTQDDLKQAITLIAEGKRLQPIQVVVAGGGGNEIQVIFPRTLNGESIVRADTKEIRLEILDPNDTVNIPFQIKKMKVGDQLVF